MSIKQQFLDLVILQKESGDYPGPLPDGLENLAQHNLITYKSFREPLDGWTLDELIGHYVNYRKLVSPNRQKLLSAEHFRLYAVCTRFPQNLNADYELEEIQLGVYAMAWGAQEIRIIVLRRIPVAHHNAIWNLFSNVQEQIEYGAAQYRT